MKHTRFIQSYIFIVLFSAYSFAQADNNIERTPISAHSQGYNTIIKYSDGYEAIRSGGTLAWRNNNPGNLRDFAFSINNGSIGQSSGFAVFSSLDEGHRALVVLLKSNPYPSLTINKAISIYAPSSQNNTKNYQRLVNEITGLPGDTLLHTLGDAQLDKIVSAISQVEGYKKGVITWRETGK